MKFALLSEFAKIPTRKNSTDAGIDLYPIRNFTIPSFGVRTVSTGITVEIPKGYFGWITNKSSKDYLIGGGIVDEGYQGELLVKVINPSEVDIIVTPDKGVAQLLIIPCKILDIEIVELSNIHQELTDRGEDGGIARENSDEYNYVMSDFYFDCYREREFFD